ncbi:MAG: vWA domain-containing protein [Polyangiaceae bacterium]
MVRISRNPASLCGALLFGCSVAAIGCGARTPLISNSIDDLDGGTTHVVSCTPGTVVLTRAIPTVMFVIDRSGSMAEGLSSGTISRWEILTNAFSETLPPVDATMQIGALLYPTGTTGRGPLTCAVPSAVNLPAAAGNVTPLLDLLHDNTPGGGTPTADALDVAANALLGTRAARSARSIVLATDGAPNCNAALDTRTCRCAQPGMGCQNRAQQCLDDTRTTDRIASYQAKGLPTYVIGILNSGDTDFVDVLNAMADAGGRPRTDASQRYYQASSAPEFNAALVAIRDQVGVCTYLTTSVPDGNGTITVTLGGVAVPYDPSGKQGWTWGDKDNGEIILGGAACTKAAMSGALTPSAEVHCASLETDGGDE